MLHSELGFRSESCSGQPHFSLSFLAIFLPRAQDSGGRISARALNSSGESPPPKAPAVVQKSEALGEGEHHTAAQPTPPGRLLPSLSITSLLGLRGRWGCGLYEGAAE